MHKNMFTRYSVNILKTNGIYQGCINNSKWIWKDSSKSNALVSLKQLKQQIAIEFIAENPEKQLFMASLFQLLFMYLYRLSVAVEHQITKSDNRTLHYFQSFQKQIKQSFHESKSVTEYAKELNITAVHLNRVCQTLVQKSALQIIHEYMINEAQKYLLNTSYTIAEISYFLDFKDPAYFTRFFKKQTGFSPSEFRGRVLPNTLSEKLFE